MGSKLRPKVVLWWGIGLALAGVLSTVLLPQLGYAVVFRPASGNAVDQALLALLELVLRIVEQVMLPLGIVLIGASVVMTYVDRATAARAADADTSAG